MKATEKPQCTICPARHRPSEPHDVSGVKVRPSLVGFTGPRILTRDYTRPAPQLGGGEWTETGEVSLGVAKPRTRRRDSEQRKKIPNAVAENPNICPGCDKPLPVGKTKPKKYHDDACRMRASRKK